MKYTTFRNLVVIGGLGALLGTCTLCSRRARDTASQPPVVTSTAPSPATSVPSSAPSSSATESPRPLPVQATKAAPIVQKTEAAGPGLALRPLDEEVLRLAGQRVNTDKVKDALPGRPYKINLYAEGGRVVRAKVDLNRNEKWDEKWSFEIEGGAPAVKRQVSPADDDSTYTQKFKLAGRSWVKD